MAVRIYELGLDVCLAASRYELPPTPRILLAKYREYGEYLRALSGLWRNYAQKSHPVQFVTGMLIVVCMPPPVAEIGNAL